MAWRYRGRAHFSFMSPTRPTMAHDSPCEDLAAWLRLSFETSASAALRLLRHIGGPQRIYDSASSELARHVPADLAQRMARPAESAVATRIEQALRWCAQPGHAIVPISAADYPAHLLTIGDAPLLLYVDGQTGCLARPGIAIVGARRATIQGRENARSFACALARQGLNIISGMAMGIDAAAHEGALAAGPSGAGTIAVAGTGLNRVYPRAHEALADRIRQQGALVSEFALDTPARPHHFPMRNRIVAGLAKGILVVEAAARSGSLITARLGNDTGRDVFALPGSIHAPLARGCHELIRQGAKLTETVEDILNEFEAYPGPAPGTQLTLSHSVFHEERDTEHRRTGPCGNVLQSRAVTALQASMGHDPIALDALMAHAGQDPAELAGALLTLELTGAVIRLSDGRYQRVRR